MHYKIGVTYVYNGRVVYTLIYNSTVRVMNSRVSGQCLYTIINIYNYTFIYKLMSVSVNNGKSCTWANCNI